MFIIYDLAHVILLPRPSPFSACNFENVGVAWDEAKGEVCGGDPEEFTRASRRRF